MRIFLIGIILGIGVFFTSTLLYAQINPFDIEFPIAELGNCSSIDECKTYCDVPANADACLVWAQSQGIEVGEPEPAQVEVPQQGGPGGCQTEEECRAFCENPDNLNECVAFAEAHGLIGPEEARIAREVHEFSGPGGCSSPEECDAFCSNPDNALTCIDFSEAEGYMTPEQAARERARINKTGPGGCRNEQECDAYCSDPGHGEECILFAVSEGYMSQEEADQILEFMRKGPPEFEGPRGPRPPGPRGPEGPKIDEEKAMELISTIGGPGGCSTFEQCDVFCSSPGNEEVCMSYAIEHDLISPEEAERMKKMMTVVGPGGCRGRECETYCDNEEHAEECIAFAEEQGFMTPEEVAETRKFIEIAKQGGPGGCRGQAECDAYCEQEQHQEECFNFAKEHDLMSPEEIEHIEKMQEMDRNVRNRGGPGGCRGEQECRDYCMDPGHFDECSAFSVQHGMMSPDQARMKMRDFVDVDREKMERMRSFEKFEPSGGPPAGGFGGPGPGAGGGTRVSIARNPSGTYTLLIEDSDGIREFSFQPQDGLRYSGGLGGCPRRHETETSFFATGEPFDSYIIDCKDNKEEFTIPSEGEYRAGGGPAGGPPAGGPPAGGFEMPERFLPAREFMEEEFEKEFEKRFQVFEQYREEFEGKAREEFIPPGEFPGPEEFPMPPEEFIEPGIMPQEEFISPEGMEQQIIEDEIQRQIQEEAERRMQEEMQRQMEEAQRQMEEQMLQETMPQPEPEPEITPTPTDLIPSVPAEEGEPVSRIQSLIGAIVAPFLELFR